MRKTLNRNLLVAVVAAMMAVPVAGVNNVHADINNVGSNAPRVSDPSNVHINKSASSFGQNTQHNDWITYTYHGKLYNADGDSPLYKQLVLHKGDSTASDSSTQDKSDNQSENSNSSNTSKPEYQGSNTNHGKLVQTGERDTAKYAGLGAVVIALIVFIVAKVRKIAKKD